MLARINKSYVPAYWDDFFNDKFFSGNVPGNRNITSPAVNVIEEDKAFFIELAAPGLDKADFKINLENGVLTISSEQGDMKEEQGRRYMRREFNYGSFSRKFELPDTIDTAKVSASHDAGVLTIELPRKEELVQNAPRQILVESGDSQGQVKKAELRGKESKKSKG